MYLISKIQTFNLTYLFFACFIIFLKDLFVLTSFIHNECDHKIIYNNKINKIYLNLTVSVLGENCLPYKAGFMPITIESESLRFIWCG